MTTETAATKKQKRRLRDAYVARLTISIPLDLDKPESYSAAVSAIAKIKTGLPAGAVIDITAGMGKLPEAELT